MQPYYAPDFMVKIAGISLESDVSSAIIDLTYDNNLDTADMFTLTLNNADLRFTDSALFDVGKNVEIHMGYVGDLHPMMLGEITAVNPSFPQSGAPTLTVTGYDKSHRMRHNHKTRSFRYSNASAIAAHIAAENQLIPVVDPSLVPFENKTQRGSDMALLKELARRNYFETYVYWDRLYFRFPRPQTEAVFLEWGRNLSSFNPRLSTSGQTGSLAIRDYDQELAQTIVGFVPITATDVDLDGVIERLGEAFIDQLTSLGSQWLSEETVHSFPDALTLAKAILSEILEGLFEGQGSCIGIPALRAGEMVDIGGVGKRFSGKYRLRRVTHTINEGGYQTSFEVTQRSRSTMLQLFRKFLEDEPPPNKQKKMDAPVVGKVVNNMDAKGLGRVQVEYAGLGGDLVSAWASVAQPDIGTYFMPDKGDDVLVMFEKGDFDRPVVTGAKWSIKKKPPESPDLKNQRKVIQSRSGHTIILDDNPQTGGVIIKDKAGSTITLQAGGKVIIDAQKDLELHAGGDINITAQDVNVKVTGTMDVS